MVERWMIVTRPSEVIILCNNNNNSYCIQHCINACSSRFMDYCCVLFIDEKITLLIICNQYSNLKNKKISKKSYLLNNNYYLLKKITFDYLHM